MAVGCRCLGCLKPQRLTSYRNRGIKTRGCLSPDYAEQVVEWGKARSGDLRLPLQLIYTALFTATGLWEPLGSAPRCQFQTLFYFEKLTNVHYMFSTMKLSTVETSSIDGVSSFRCSSSSGLRRRHFRR